MQYVNSSSFYMTLNGSLGKMDMGKDMFHPLFYTLGCHSQNPPTPFQKCWIRPWSLPPKKPQEKEKKCGAYPHNRVQLCHLNCLAILTGGGGQEGQDPFQGDSCPSCSPLGYATQKKMYILFQFQDGVRGPCPPPLRGGGQGLWLHPGIEKVCIFFCSDKSKKLFLVGKS